jgi:hypothetical protein
MKASNQLINGLIKQLEAANGRSYTHKDLAKMLGTTQYSLRRAMASPEATKQVLWILNLMSLVPEERRNFELSNFFKDNT